MIDVEADDALGAAAVLAAADPRVERVFICTPDKDLAQSVRGTRVVQLHRRTRTIVDEAGVIAKFGVPPASIPDYLALVGDAADGFPGLPGWGAKSSATVLARYGHIELIPEDPRAWSVSVASAARLAETLRRERERALLFRTLATLRTDIALFDDVETLRWGRLIPIASLDRAARRLGHLGAGLRLRPLSAQGESCGGRRRAIAPDRCIDEVVHDRSDVDVRIGEHEVLVVNHLQCHGGHSR